MVRVAVGAMADGDVAARHGSGAAGAAVEVVPVGVLAAARALAAGMGGAAGWSVSRRRAVLGEVDRAIAVLGAVRAELLLAERAGGTWRTHGDPSFEAWRGRTSRGGQRAALAEIGQAEVLAALPALREATVDGGVSPAHVEVLARVVRGASPTVRAAMGSTAGQAELLGLARADATTFARSVARWAAHQDPDALERDHQAQRAARAVHLVDTPGGTRLSGLLDTMAGHRLRLALEAVTPRPALEDDRTAEQRRADALETLATTVLALPETGSGAAVRPHVSFLMTESTWSALRAAPRGTAPAPCAPVTLEDGTPVPPTEAAAALCDCELTRIVLDAESVPIDLGRTQRLYTGPQRRAVIARDRHCAWPGCTTHARWCQIHHIAWWDRDAGSTSVDNGILLCSFHHHETHRRDLTIARHRPPPGAPGGPATASYRFTDRTGHALPPPPEDPRGPGDVGAAGSAAPPEQPPDQRPARARPSELTGHDLEHVTDPVTGMSVPRFLLTG